MKLHKILILLTCFFFIHITSANGFDEYGGGYGFSTTGYDSYGGHYADPSYIGQGFFITPAYAYSAPGTPNGGYNNPYIVPGFNGNSYTTYTYTSSYTTSTSPDTWSSMGHLSPREAANIVLGPNDLLVPWYSSDGGQWFTLYRDFKPGYPVLLANQTTVYVLEANNFVYNNYGPNIYYSYNVYNNANGGYSYGYYQSTASGTRPPTGNPTPYTPGSTVTYPTVTYNPIPKVPNVGSLTFLPGSPFYTAMSLYNSTTSLSLPQALMIVREYIDKVIPEAPNGRKTYIEKVIARVALGLPASQKIYAESLLVMYSQLNDANLSVDNMLPLVTAFHGKPMPFANDLVLFTKEVIELAKNTPNEADRNNLINIMLTIKNGNYNTQGFNNGFDIAVNPYVDMDTTMIDPNNPLMTHLVIEYTVLKSNHPTWSEWKLWWEASKTYLHVALDGLGLVPVVGEGADLINGALYTIEGDGVNATLSFASAVPFVGWVSTGTKYGLKVINISADVASKVRLVWKIEGNLITFGSRAQLRKVLRLAVGDARQAHHIIPWAKSTHTAVQKAAKSPNAFHMNELINGIPLSTAVHNGSHAHYDDLIQTYLDAIPANATPAQAYDKIVVIINKVKTAIANNPTTKLNDLIF